MVGAVPWYHVVVRGPIRMIDSYWQIPEALGLGIEVDESVCDAHPFKQGVIHPSGAVLRDGTVVDW
jgi:galactonate dehydratase